MLLELAIGDAYGAGFEYVRDRRYIRRLNDLSVFVKHPTHRIKPGCYTDDTQMTLAIAELIVADTEWTPEAIATSFVDAFRRDPRQGYSGRFYTFLKGVRSGTDFLANIHPVSDKSGAAMRSAPIGIYADEREVIRRCTLQAQITHNTRDGIAAAVAAALASHYLLYSIGPKNGLPAYLQAHLPGDWTTPWVGEVGAKGWMSVRAAMTSILRHQSLSAILQSAVAWGGDVDTVASIALAVAACSREVRQDLPPALVRNLENGTYGRQYLQDLEVRLMKKLSQEQRRARTRSRC